MKFHWVTRYELSENAHLVPVTGWVAVYKVSEDEFVEDEVFFFAPTKVIMSRHESGTGRLLTERPPVIEIEGYVDDRDFGGFECAKECTNFVRYKKLSLGAPVTPSAEASLSQ